MKTLKNIEEQIIATAIKVQRNFDKIKMPPMTIGEFTKAASKQWKLEQKLQELCKELLELRKK